MDKATQISKYIEKVFDLYHINKMGFFSDYDCETGKEYKIPLFRGNQIDNETINRLSVKLGLSSEEIFNLDKKAAYKYWNKYPFFKLYDLFLATSAYNFKYKISEKEILFRIIFGEENSSKDRFKERYDYESVKDRMIEQLKEMDSFMPGTFRPNASIVKLTFSTEFMISFPKITEMIRSYIDMVKTVEKFFFRALSDDLSQEEINEYNFLVSFIEVVDVINPAILLTYDNICILKQVYLEEGFNDFSSYARLKSFANSFLSGANPWRCKEFFDDMELLKDLAYIFPPIKEKLRNFVMQLKHFQCTFIWSNAKRVEYEDGFFGPLEENVVYVEKTKEELFDWEPYIDKINQIISPSNKDVFKVRKNISGNFNRFQSRWNKIEEVIRYGTHS